MRACKVGVQLLERLAAHTVQPRPHQRVRLEVVPAQILRARPELRRDGGAPVGSVE